MSELDIKHLEQEFENIEEPLNEDVPLNLRLKYIILEEKKEK